MSLPQLVRETRRARGWSLGDVVTAAEKAGYKISRSRVHNIETGVSEIPRDDAFEALAAAFNMPLSKMRRAAGQPEREPAPFLLPDHAKHLTGRERELIIAMVNALLRAHGKL